MCDHKLVLNWFSKVTFDDQGPVTRRWHCKWLSRELGFSRPVFLYQHCYWLAKFAWSSVCVSTFKPGLILPFGKVLRDPLMKSSVKGLHNRKCSALTCTVPTLISVMLSGTWIRTSVISHSWPPTEINCRINFNIWSFSFLFASMGVDYLERDLFYQTSLILWPKV